jgi:hypothetical protein
MSDARSSAGSGGSDLLSGRSGRVAIGAVVAYVALVAYATATGDPTADLAADAFFGLGAVAFGVAFAVTEGPTPLASAAGASIAGAGVATLGGVLTGEVSFDVLSNLLLFVGVGLYFVSRYRSR